MKQALVIIVILVVAGLAYWFLTKDIVIDDTSSVTKTQELVPPALPE